MNARNDIRSALLAAGALLLAACEDAAGPAPAAPPATVVVLSGDGQSGVAGNELAAPLSVLVTDREGNAVGNAAVLFSVASGGGLLLPPAASTDAAGRAEARWTLGTSTAEPHRAEARVAGGDGDLVATFSATASPGPPATIRVSAPAAELHSGSSLQLAASVADAHGNPVPGATVVWTSETPAVASVDPDGLVTGLTPGEVALTASSGGARGSVTLRVLGRPSPREEVRFTLGAPEVVFRYRRDRCETWDLPDMTARAVRMPDGTLALYSGNAPRAYASFGPDFASLQRSCVPTLVSDDDVVAESFRNQEWLSTVYREGSLFHAIVHNEFHDPLHANCKQGDTSPANPCWYNALTYASSSDGRAFTRPPPPAHVLAGPPQRWDPSGPRPPGPYGYFAPSNILRLPDGYYYAMFFTIPDRDEPTRRGSCVMRTRDLGDPTSWLAWDGSAFTVAMPSPYEEAATGVACTIVLGTGIDGSLTWNTHLERYLYVGATAGVVDGVIRCGFLFSVSEDLVTWSPPGLIKEAPVPFPPCGSGPNAGREYYPALIDHADTSVNFENTGRTPHLYYTRYNDEALDRDLLRVPVVIEPVDGR